MATLTRGHELQNLLSTGYHFFKTLKYSFWPPPPTLLFFDSPARGGHNSYTTASDVLLTNSFFMFLMWTYLNLCCCVAVKLFIIVYFTSLCVLTSPVLFDSCTYNKIRHTSSTKLYISFHDISTLMCAGVN